MIIDEIAETKIKMPAQATLIDSGIPHPERLYGGARYKSGIDRRQFFKHDWFSKTFDRIDQYFIFKRGDAFHLFKEYALIRQLEDKFPGWFPQVCEWFNYDGMFSGGFKAEYDLPGQPAELRLKPEIPLTKVKFISPRLDDLLEIIPEMHKIAYLPRRGYHPGHKKFDKKKFKYSTVHFFVDLLAAVYDKSKQLGIAPLLSEKPYFSMEEMWEGCADPAKFPQLHELDGLVKLLKEESRHVDEVTEFIVKSKTAYEDYRGLQVIHGDIRIENMLLHLNWMKDEEKAELILDPSGEIIVGKEGHLMLCDLENADVGLRYRDITKLLESHNIEILTIRKLTYHDKMEFLAKYMERFHMYNIRNDILLEAEPLYWAQAYLDNLRLARSCLIEQGIYRIEFAQVYLRQAQEAKYYFDAAKKVFEEGKMGVLGEYLPMKKNFAGALFERIMPNSYHTSTKISNPGKVPCKMPGKYSLLNGKFAFEH